MDLDIFKNRVSVASALLRKKRLSSSSPQEVIIEITKRCNLRCPGCVRTYLDNSNAKDLTLEEFFLFLENISRKTELITLAGLGEPLLNPEAVNMVYQSKRKGFKTALYTNAVLLKPDISKGLLDAGLSGIVISFDGATEETYQHFRKGASFPEVKRNILDFLDIKRKLKSRVFVEVQMIVFKENRPEIKAFRDAWAVSGVDSVRVKNDQMRVYNREDPPGEQDCPARKGFCSMPWRGPATVNIFGDVYPCCVGSGDNMVIGNLFKSGMEQIWSSNPANQLRADFIAKGGSLTGCRGCHIPFPPQVFCALGALLDPLLIYRAYAKAESMFDPHSGRIEQ